MALCLVLLFAIPLARRILALQLPPAGAIAAEAAVVLAAIAALTLWRRFGPGHRDQGLSNSGLTTHRHTTPRSSKRHRVNRHWVSEEVSTMSKLIRGAGLLIIAGLTGLAGCGTTQAVSPGAAKSPAPASSTPAPRTTAPSPSATDKPTVTPGGTSGACSQPGRYLTSVRVGEYDGYDRVVFQF